VSSLAWLAPPHLLEDLVLGVLVVLLEAGDGRVHHAQRLLEGLLQGAADGHDLAHGLHGGADLLGHGLELAQVPAGHLGHDVVEGRLEARLRLLRDGVLDLREGDAEAELRGERC
jgi:hypothetical protein